MSHEMRINKNKSEGEFVNWFHITWKENPYDMPRSSHEAYSVIPLLPHRLDITHGCSPLLWTCCLLTYTTRIYHSYILEGDIERATQLAVISFIQRVVSKCIQ